MKRHIIPPEAVESVWGKENGDRGWRVGERMVPSPKRFGRCFHLGSCRDDIDRESAFASRRWRRLCNESESHQRQNVDQQAQSSESRSADGSVTDQGVWLVSY